MHLSFFLKFVSARHHWHQRFLGHSCRKLATHRRCQRCRQPLRMWPPCVHAQLPLVLLGLSSHMNKSLAMNLDIDAATQIRDGFCLLHLIAMTKALQLDEKTCPQKKSESILMSLVWPSVAFSETLLIFSCAKRFTSSPSRLSLPVLSSSPHVTSMAFSGLQ